MDYDLNTPRGQQQFQNWIVQIVRNEINSYVRQVLYQRDAVNITIPVDPTTGAPYANKNDEQDARIARLEQATFRR